MPHCKITMMYVRSLLVESIGSTTIRTGRTIRPTNIWIALIAGLVSPRATPAPTGAILSALIYTPVPPTARRKLWLRYIEEFLNVRHRIRVATLARARPSFMIFGTRSQPATALRSQML